jgi:hypothetical protein
MSDRPTSEMVVGAATVNGRELEIVRLTWSNTPGLSYDVYDKAAGECLTEDGSFDDIPTDEDLNGLLDRTDEERAARGAAGGLHAHPGPGVGVRQVAGGRALADHR